MSKLNYTIEKAFDASGRELPAWLIFKQRPGTLPVLVEATHTRSQARWVKKACDGIIPLENYRKELLKEIENTIETVNKYDLQHPELARIKELLGHLWRAASHPIQTFADFERYHEHDWLDIQNGIDCLEIEHGISTPDHLHPVTPVRN